MRKQFVATVEALLESNPRVILLLGDIGVFGFRNAAARYPRRVYNLGILEQSCVSLAAGLAKEGFIPIFHSIAPFVVERAFEQIKIDFGYQNLECALVSVGASYDYASLGCTHHCPGDVALMKAVPNVQIFTPGAPSELDLVLRQTIGNGRPKYVRLSEYSHNTMVLDALYKAVVIKKGRLGTIIAAGPNLRAVSVASEKLDITVLYYMTLEPFDSDTLRENCPTEKVMVVEPFYAGTLSYDIQRALEGCLRTSVRSLGVPRQFLTSYGKASEHDAACGLTSDRIAQAAREFFHG